MAKKSKPDNIQEAQAAPQIEAAEVEVVKTPAPLFSAHNWKGVLVVYKCLACGTFRDLKDEIILHVLTHLPAEQREAVLANLLKE